VFTSNKMIAQILKNLPGNLYWKNTKGIYLGCNNNFCNLLGKTEKEVIGKRDNDFFDSEVCERLRAIDESVITKLEPFEGDEVYKNITYLSQKIPLVHKNKCLGLLGISFDITERKEQEQALAIALEKAEAANNAKTVFTSSVSHDMRTPLTGILGALELIQLNTPSTPKLEQLFAGAKKCGETLLNMINRVMDFAQREYVGITVHKEPVNLHQLAIDCIDMYAPTAEKKGIKLDLDYRAPHVVNTDFHRAQEILLNLVGNAVKFTDFGEVKLKVEGTEKALKIAVQDTGIGIEHDMHEAVFERYTRGVRSDRSKYPGHGLGLAKVKGSVEALEGEILLQSEPGKGSLFEVYIGT
jgi:two-component system aerobic respiration control sensor histidine kinase ArcB